MKIVDEDVVEYQNLCRQLHLEAVDEVSAKIELHELVAMMQQVYRPISAKDATTHRSRREALCGGQEETSGIKR